MEDEKSTLWEEVNPAWMFQVRPRDFMGYRRSAINPGFFYMPGLANLFLFHYVCFAPFFYALCMSGYRSTLILYLLPVTVLWLIVVPADIKFRLQRPTRDERDAFDNVFVNRFGLLSSVASLFIIPAAVIVAIIAFVWHLFAR